MTILYGLRQTSNSGKTYYYDFINYHWSASLNENTLTSDVWLAQEIGDKHFPNNYEIVRFEVKEIDK